MLRSLFALVSITLALTAQALDFPFSVPMTERASGNLYVTATFETGSETELLVDTGSGYVALSKSTFSPLRDLETTTFVRHMNAVMANGRRARLPIYQIAKLKLGAHCIVRNVEVAVLPKQSANILGLSALRQVQPFALDLNSTSLLLSACATSTSPTQPALVASDKRSH